MHHMHVQETICKHKGHKYKQKISLTKHLVCLIHNPATGQFLQQALSSLHPNQLWNPARLWCLHTSTEVSVP